MPNNSKRILTFLFTALFAVVFCTTPVFATDTEAKPKDPGLMAADIVLARPVGAAATVTGFILFVVSSPFSALGGNTKEAWESLVVSPATYSFQRPLGHFDETSPRKDYK
jgi:hypothetical protein